MNNPLNFTDKVALVTGAASGTGLATAVAFDEAGASVVLASRGDSAGKRALAGRSRSQGDCCPMRRP